jgi:uncharacterized tellurite resistance protein B-like protein
LNNSDIEVEKEYRRYRRWKFLSWLGRMFRVGTILRTDSGKWPGGADSPPMVELSKLAKDGLKDAPSRRRLDMDDLQRAILICSEIARADGELTETERELARQFALQNGPESISDEQLTSLLRAFQTGPGGYQRLRNEIFLLKRDLNRHLAKRLVETLFRLAYTGGLEPKESRDAADIAGRLGLEASEIRLAQMHAKREQLGA